MERHQQCLRQYDVATQTEVVEESSPTRIVTDFAVPREEPEVEERGEEVMSTNDKGAQLAPASVGLDLHPLTPTPATVERFPYNWEKEGALRVVYASQMKEYDARVRRTMAQRVRKGAKKLYRSLSTNLPFLSIVVAIVIGIVPFLRSIFIGGPLEMFMDTVGVLSGGTIPCCLLLLGAKLVGPTANKEDEEEDDTPAPSRNVEQNTTLPLFKEDLQLVGDDASFADEYNMALDEVVVDEFDFNASFVTGDHHLHVVVEAEEGEDKRKPSFLDSIFDLGEANKTFVWGLIVAKLVIIPAVTFVFLILVSKVLLAVGGDTFKSKTLFYVLFSQMTAPTGIKTQLLYNQADFMVAEWSKMLSLQHLLGVVSTLIWTCLSLFYVRGMY
ncbi:Membrane transport protein, putative [Angomonas deanei]|uniref:Membrane transport protein, putative n=1 Tax=Angomonas deanei TaxID=59799 RepID=A0A7G2CL13_9TRYP|nr:Membrane transport protein, putative [Angomonas deanei]